MHSSLSVTPQVSLDLASTFAFIFKNILDNKIMDTKLLA